MRLLLHVLGLVVAIALTFPHGRAAHHERIVSAAALDVHSTVRLGDSITAWRPPDSTLNAGVPGDTVRGALWRVEHGALPPHVRHVVVSLGVNDLRSGRTALEVASDTLLLVERIRQLRPMATVEVTTILPTSTPSVNQSAEQVARLLRESGQPVTDTGRALLDESGAVRPDVLVDGLHLTLQGYCLISAAESTQ